MYHISLIGTYPITSCKIYQRGFFIVVLNWGNSCKYNIGLIFFLENVKFNLKKLSFSMKVNFFGEMIGILIGFCSFGFSIRMKKKKFKDVAIQK